MKMIVRKYVLLLAAPVMLVGTFLVVSDMKPYKWPRQYDIRSTDDKHVMAIDLAANKTGKEDLKRILKENGATEIHEKSF